MIKQTKLAVDFLNKCILTNQVLDKTSVTPELIDRFLADAVDPFWHSEKDKLDFFAYYTTDEWFCQRRKLKTDFSRGTSYWVTYSFTGATDKQAKEFFDLCVDFFSLTQEVKNLAVNAKISEIDKENLFFEQRYLKKESEKNLLLQLSDWRVLPDVEDSYPGEKDRWIKWRSYLRNETLKKPSDFESNLEFFKYSYDIKYPIDPSVYRDLYPGGFLEDGATIAPEYMDPQDSRQWVSYDAEASTDFIKQRVKGIYNLNGQYKQSYRKVKSSVLELMKLLKVDDLTEVDWDKYYTENDSNVNFDA